MSNPQSAIRNPQSIDFTIEGMDCADCALTIEKAVAALPGIESATVNFGAARLSVVLPLSERGTTAPTLTSVVERKVSEAGYRATPMQQGQSSIHAWAAQQPYWRRERRVLTTGVGALISLIAFALTFTPLPSYLPNALFAAAILIAGHSFARAGLLALRSRRADMNLLMTIAVLGAAAIGDWGEAATVVLLFSFGGALQSYTLDRTRNAIRSLMQIAPTTALVRRIDRSSGLPIARETRLPVDQVAVGEAVIIAPGERIPLDGTVVAGVSSVDQSPITGESIPVDVQPESQVFAGSINGSGLITIRVTNTSSDTTLAHIISLVEEAQATRAPSQQLVDRFSAIYTPIVILGAILVALIPPILFAQPFGDWFYRALVLLVVACPCALVISTPVSIVAAIGAATRRGILLKGGSVLEQLARIRVVAFDKTGTLTQGRPYVASVHSFDGDPHRLLQLAAAAESRSEHPLARAIVHEARTQKAGASTEYRVSSTEYQAVSTQYSVLGTHDSFTAHPGMGAHAIVADQHILAGNSRLFEEKGIPLDSAAQSLLDALHSQGQTAVLVGTSTPPSPPAVLGIIALADTLRPQAAHSLQSLRRAGIPHIAMLTGDNPRAAASIASSLGIPTDHTLSALLPAGKVAAVRRLRDLYGPIAMVGDGINDAPALATADVGIAMGIAGTDAALEVADVALMSDDLSRLPFAIKLSRRAVRVIRQNITISLAIKALALVLAAFGALPLWAAILADMGVSLLVTLNGMALLAVRSSEYEVPSTE